MARLTKSAISLESIASRRIERKRSSGRRAVVANVRMRLQSLPRRHQLELEGRSPGRADVRMLAALFIIALTAALPAGALYWLMRPTVLPNPGIASYRPPRPDPLLPLVARQTRDVRSISAMKRENGSLPADPGSAFAAVQDAEPASEGLASTTIGQQRRQRSARKQSRQQNPSFSARGQAAPFNNWANRDHSFASWYR